MSDDPDDSRKTADEERRKRLNSPGAEDRMGALQERFRKTGVGKSQGRFSFGSLKAAFYRNPALAGVAAFAILVILSLAINLFGRNGSPN
jgi:hypothetical protein